MQNMLLLFLFGIVNNIQTSPAEFQLARETTAVGDDRRETKSPQIVPAVEMGTQLNA
jgi:hypothetical protein